MRHNSSQPHRCIQSGCDASILLDYDYNQGTSEMASSKNFGIRNRESISEIKSVVEQECAPGRSHVLISWHWQYMAIPLGRKDSTTSSTHRADEELPSAAVGSDGALRLFASKGMTIEESVAIMAGVAAAYRAPLGGVHFALEDYLLVEKPAYVESFLHLHCCGCCGTFCNGWCKSGKCGHFGSGGFIIWEIPEEPETFRGALDEFSGPEVMRPVVGSTGVRRPEF